MNPLLDDAELTQSSVVANCAMNRERGLSGYRKELGVDILTELRTRLDRQETVRWLDLCCGSAKALSEAAGLLGNGRQEIVGVDLVDFYAPSHLGVRLVTASITDWEPGMAFDLITCVHGLHYVGDKLAAIARAVSWLTEDGLFAASFDTASIVAPGKVGTFLKASGLMYDARCRRLSRRGHAVVTFPFGYLGADDKAGPNYTGQPAVVSYYGRDTKVEAFP
jgi:SAM-dependent methyltransferase